MSCELDFVDCTVISNAAFGLERYACRTEEEIKEYVKDYGKENIIVRAADSRLKDTVKARTGLLEIANSCGCDIDLKTGVMK